jgi:hypothetical protein
VRNSYSFSANTIDGTQSVKRSKSRKNEGKEKEC